MNVAQRLYNEATEIYGQIKSILDLESVSAEQEAQLDTLFAAFDEKTTEAKKQEKLAERAAELRARVDGMAEPSNRLGTPRQSTQADANAERAMEALLRGVLKEQPRHRGGDRPQDEPAKQPATCGRLWGLFAAPHEKSSRHVTDVTPIVRQHGNERSKMHEHPERLHRDRVNVQQQTGQSQMRRA